MWRAGCIAGLIGAMLFLLSFAAASQESRPRTDQFPEIHRLLASNDKA